jgi:hypothetical protein
MPWFLLRKLPFLLCTLLITNSCREKETEPPINDALSTPISLAADTSGQYFYVLNSDFLHAYESGSILVLDQNGKRVSATPVPHLGKVLSVSGNDLLVSFDHESEETASRTFLYNIADPKKPVFVKEWIHEGCTPANLVSRNRFKYFALSCQEGDLYVGKLEAIRSQSEMTKVRSYPVVGNSTRRAMYLDPKRQLLFLFVSDIGTGTLSDALDSDKETWLKGQKISDKPDEIPDSLQQTAARAGDILNRTSQFQFVIYDIGAEFSAGFRNYNSVRDTELRWLYFDLNNFDGTPDKDTIQGNPDQKTYRTNFWEAQPDPDDLDSFYLSHRGFGKVNSSENANDLVKFTFIGDPRTKKDGTVPKLGTYWSFQRSYGFKGDQTGDDKYFNSFKITKFSGRKAVLLNSFRDLSSFSNPRYTIAGANLVEGHNPAEWFTQVDSRDLDRSYYDLALGANGNLLTISFFDETLKLFKVKFGEAMTLINSIE